MTLESIKLMTKQFHKNEIMKKNTQKHWRTWERKDFRNIKVLKEIIQEKCDS